MQNMRSVIPILLAASCCASGAEPAKPACNAQTRGELWPETGRVSGTPIEICSKAHRKYRWQQLTVDVSQLKGAPRRKPVIATLANVTRTDTNAGTDATHTNSFGVERPAEPRAGVR
jgi:hypothetical protein